MFRYNIFYLTKYPEGVDVGQFGANEIEVEPVGISFEINGQGGVYLLLISGTKNKAVKHVFQVAPANALSILWQVPQIVIITASEILFSISGLEFAYSQAAPSMKSLVQACWLLTSAIGDTLIVIIALLNIPNMAIEFLFYSVLMLIVIIIFALLAAFYYEYKDNNDHEEVIDYRRLSLDAKFDNFEQAQAENWENAKNVNVYNKPQYSTFGTPEIGKRNDEKNGKRDSFNDSASESSRDHF